MKKASVIYYEAYDGYTFISALEKSRTIRLEKNFIQEWREVTGQNPICHGFETNFKNYQKSVREKEVLENIVTINPGLTSKI